MMDKEELTKAQKNFLSYCHKFGWGKVEVIIKDGQPVMVSPIKRDIKLDIDTFGEDML